MNITKPVNIRQNLINAGKVWQVYRDKDAENILFEGLKTKCLSYIRENFGMRSYTNGRIRLAKVIWEKS